MTEAFWYAARGTGVISLVLLTLVVWLGIVGRSGRPLPGLPRFAVGDLHRNASLVGVGFIAVHLLTLLADPYAQLRLLDLVVPFNATYRPFWLGLGTVTSDLIIVLILTSLVRHRLGARAWRAVHWLAYGAWPFALLHALGTGTDSGQLWLRLFAVACAGIVIASLLWRLSANFAEHAQSRLDRMRAVDPGAR
jgi:methionine sulfoxide reductase heme-binding subunit